MFIGLYVTRAKSSAAVSRLMLPVHRFNVTINKQQTVTRLYLVTSIWSCPRAECTFCFITSIVFVLFPGVFNSAEAWRQCHIGHDVEGKTAAKMWDWHKDHHLQLHQQIVLIWRNKCILPHDSDLFSVSCLSVCLCHSCLLAAQTSRHAGGEEPHRASAGRHLRPRPHPESPQLRPLGTRLLHVV